MPLKREPFLEELFVLLGTTKDSKHQEKNIAARTVIGFSVRRMFLGVERVES